MMPDFGDELHRHVRSAADPANADRYQRGLATAIRQTASIVIRGKSEGTGLLVTPNVVLTAYHVVSDAVAGKWNATQLHVEFYGGEKQPNERRHLVADWYMGGSARIDYALLELADDPQAAERGWTTLRSPESLDDKEITILHFGNANAVGHSTGFVTERTADRYLIYDATAIPGSSGGPCFNPEFELMGIHIGAHLAANRGISTAAIVLHLWRDDTLKERFLAAEHRAKHSVTAAGTTEEAARGGEYSPPTGDVALDNLASVAVTAKTMTFVGRDKAVAALHSHLGKKRRAVITGPPGVGKTYLALEYVRRHRLDYDIVWWLRGASIARMLEGYAQLGYAAMACSSTITDVTTVFERVKQWLARRGKWLIIIDAAAEPEALKGWLPPAQHGHVIVTSHHDGWRAEAGGVRLKPLSRQDGVRLIRSELNDVSVGEATALFETVNGLPLELVQACAYIDRANKSVAEYVTLFAARRRDIRHTTPAAKLLEHEFASSGLVSLDAIGRTNREALELLCLMALCAPDPMSRELMSLGAAQLPVGLRGLCADQLKFDTAVGVLKDFCMIGTHRRVVSMHAAVQAAVRLSLNEEEEKDWAEVAIDWLAEGFPSGKDAGSWDVCRRLFPHVSAIATSALDLNVGLESCVTLCRKVGSYFTRRGLGEFAKAHLERGLRAAEAVGGKSCAEAGDMHSRLGSVYYHLGDHKKASKHFDVAKTITHSLMNVATDRGQLLRMLGRDLNHQATMEEERGNLEVAESLYRHAYQYNDEAEDDEHRAASLIRMARVQCARGNYLEAKHNAERALTIDLRAFGETHDYVATCQNTIGRILLAQGDYEEGMIAATRARDINMATFGENNLLVAGDYELVALLQEGRAKVDMHTGDGRAAVRHNREALRASLRARSVREKLLHEKHPVVIGTKIIVAVHLTLCKRRKWSEQLFSAVEESLKSVDDRKLKLLATIARGRLQEIWGRPCEAARQYQLAVDANRSTTIDVATKTTLARRLQRARIACEQAQ